MLPGQDTLIACWSALSGDLTRRPRASVHRGGGGDVPAVAAAEQRDRARRRSGDAIGCCVRGGARLCRRGCRRVGVVGGELRRQLRGARPSAGGRRAAARHDDARHAGRPGSRAPLARRGRRSIAHRHRPPRERGASAGARARCAGDHARPLGVGAGGRPDGGGLRVDLPPPAGLRHLCRRDVAGLATQGVGRTLMEHVLADARRRGARTASLQSTRMGQPLYESLGFTPVGRYEEWVSR